MSPKARKVRCCPGCGAGMPDGGPCSACLMELGVAARDDRPVRIGPYRILDVLGEATGDSIVALMRDSTIRVWDLNRIRARLAELGLDWD